jgi:hypothetical protein
MGTIRRLASTCGLALVLSACGGGGGSSGDSGFIPPTDDFDVRTAWTNFLVASRSWAVAGVANNGLGYDVTISVQPGATSVVPISGATAARSDTRLIVRENGATVGNALSETFHDAATRQMLGTRFTPLGGASLCSLASATAAPPQAAKIGASGALATLDERDGCSSSSASVGTATVRWSLAFEGGISYFCIDSTERDLAGNVLATESDCLEVSPDGSLGARARITITQPGTGFSLTARG